ncbi:MAG: hypothetical protein Q8O31_03170 [Rhodocyclaceae bacterium]|nr:hypothetical protein [Rhodocyclaceae bacterium]
MTSVVALAEPAVIYDQEGNTPRLEGSVKVTSRLMQIKITEHLILSMEENGEFAIESLPSSGYKIRIITGPATAINLAANTVSRLPMGNYLTDATSTHLQPFNVASPLLSSNRTEPLDIIHRQGYQMSDYVMVRQNEYLAMDLLQPINSFLASLLRNLAKK